MTQATPGIPEPPRNIRWRPCLARRGSLGRTATGWATAGIITLTLALCTGEGGPLFGDTKLDSGASTCPGTVIAIEHEEGMAARITFQFEPPDHFTRQGESFADSSQSFAMDQPVDVEYWAEDPGINRISGTEALYLSPLLSIIGRMALVLGLLGSVHWFRSVMTLRFALRDGRATEAQIIECNKRLWARPAKIRIRYRFQDEKGEEFVHSHWVRHTSEMAYHLLVNKPRSVTVIHDQTNPQVSRLVIPSDFISEGAAQRGIR